jgi:hypothetical protein
LWLGLRSEFSASAAVALPPPLLPLLLPPLLPLPLLWSARHRDRVLEKGLAQKGCLDAAAHLQTACDSDPEAVKAARQALNQGS